MQWTPGTWNPTICPHRIPRLVAQSVFFPRRYNVRERPWAERANQQTLIPPKNFPTAKQHVHPDTSIPVPRPPRPRCIDRPPQGVDVFVVAVHVPKVAVTSKTLVAMMTMTTRSWTTSRRRSWCRTPARWNNVGARQNVKEGRWIWPIAFHDQNRNHS
jgi:hypothetical protein